MATTDPAPDSLLPLPTAVFHILIALADRERHGYSIMQDVARRTNSKVQLSAGVATQLNSPDARTGTDRRTVEEPRPVQ